MDIFQALAPVSGKGHFLFLEVVDVEAEAFFQVHSGGFDNVEKYPYSGDFFAFSEVSYVFSGNVAKKGYVLLGIKSP